MNVLATVGGMLGLVCNGLMAGLYFAFSLSVVPGLTEAGARHAVPAMRGMNDRIMRPLFFLAFFGAPLVPLLTGVLLLVDSRAGAATAFLLAGGVCGLGGLIPTVAVNVPLNERLADEERPSRETEDEVSERLWAAYAPRWQSWNTLRALASTLGTLLVGFGLYLL